MYTTTTTAKTIILFAVLFWGTYVMSQPTRYYFDHLTTKEGLSQNDINCILQDAMGFMWFGTNDGLNLYDGYDFTVYRPIEGDSTTINSTIIQALAEDHLGRIWVGTTGEGLSCFLPKHKRFVNLKDIPAFNLALPSDFITNLFVDRSDRLWISTSKGLRLFQLSEAYEVKKNSMHDITDTYLSVTMKNRRIDHIYEDEEGVIWLSTNAGLYKLWNNTDSSGPFLTRQVFKQAAKGIVPGKENELIVGTGRGLRQVKLQKNGPPKVIKIDGSNHDFVLYNAGAVWTSSPNGLTKFVYGDGDILEKEHVYTSDLSDFHSLSKTVLRTIYADRNGIMWIGTNGGGVNKFEPKQKTFFHYKETLAQGSLSYDKVRSVYEDSYQNLWVGTEGGGINFLPANDSGRNTYQGFSHISYPANVFALAEYECKGNRYMLMGGQIRPGLYQMPIHAGMKSLAGMDITPFPEIRSSVFAILNVENCDVWVGTYHNGLYRINAQNQKVRGNYVHDPEDPSTISSDLIRSLMEDKDGNIWIGTGRGLNRLNAEDLSSPRPTFVSYLHEASDPLSISHDYILALFQSEAGDIWIGTFGGGLNKFVPASKGKPAHFVAYTEADGLPNNVVKGILEDEEGFLWLSTNKGLTRFNPSTGVFYNFDTRDGLQSDEFSELAQFKRKNGDMIFGGVNGFNVFKASSVHLNPNPPQVALTEFQVLNKTVEVGEEFNHRILLDQALAFTPEIHLKHHENSFSLGFSAFHYRAPVKNKYAYMLEGLHTDWIHVGADKRFVNFTNLDPGTYVFKVKASNSDGVWNEMPTQVTIHIAPPFWLTWWAFLVYATILIGMVWLLAHYTFIGIREKHQLMLEHFEREKQEELQQMKLQFFTNISHELRTPLSLISGPMDYLIQSGQGLSYELREKQYHLIRKNAQYLLRLANQLLDFRKVDQGVVKLQVHNHDIVTYIREISEPFQFIASKQAVSFHIDAYPGEINTWYDPEIVEKVVYNLLSNAFKYTPEQGNISLDVRLKTEKTQKPGSKGISELVEIRVKDTGPGVPKKDRQKIFHRFYKGEQTPLHNTVGVGIGLSYTKELVELHHGSIWVEENELQGACFVVVLPRQGKAYSPQERTHTPTMGRKKAKYAPIEFQAAPVTVDLSKTANGIGQHEEKPTLESDTEVAELPLMLIIDDNRDIRTFLNDAFKDDYQVMEAPNGKVGWEMAQEHSPNLIVSDVMMPHMNGVELCVKLKEDYRTSHIPIVLLTAKTSEEGEIEGLKNGADAYIRKPFSLDILKYKIANILKTREEMRTRFRREVILETKEVTVTSTDELFLKKTMELIEANMTEPDFNVEAMVKEIGMSRSKLYLKLKALTGQSSSEFIRTVRLKRAAQLLESSGLTVKEIMYMTGFNTASYFSKCFKKQFGVVPSEYVRQKNATSNKVVQP